MVSSVSRSRETHATSVPGARLSLIEISLFSLDLLGLYRSSAVCPGQSWNSVRKTERFRCRPGFDHVIGSLLCRFLGHSFLLLSQRFDLLASRSLLVCRQGQQRDPSHHRSEQRSRQVRWALLWGPFGTTLIAPTSALATATCALLIVW